MELLNSITEYINVFRLKYPWIEVFTVNSNNQYTYFFIHTTNGIVEYFSKKKDVENYINKQNLLKRKF